MNRWNVSDIFFLSVHGLRRDVTLKPDEVNIITGASGTGKSTLIKAIDYCLGSSKCELPAHVRRRCVAVGVKWTSASGEFIVGRVVPPVGPGTSTRMYVVAGWNLALPRSLEEFQGATNLDAAKAFLEKTFGIGDRPGEPDAQGRVRGRATVRHVTPYMFVTKEVIYSETILLHGLEQPDEAPGIIETLPYFLRASDDATAIDERQLRGLQKKLERELAARSEAAAAGSALKDRAIALLGEANRAGFAAPPDASAGEAVLLTALRSAASENLGTAAYPSEGELAALHEERRDILMRLANARRRWQAARTAIQDVAGFAQAVSSQREKLQLAEHLRIDTSPSQCPLCDAKSETGARAAASLRVALDKIRNESAAVERVRPKLSEHDRTVTEEIDALNQRLRAVDVSIRSWLNQTEETKRLSDSAQLRAHLQGRISYFLETAVPDQTRDTSDLDVLRSQIAELEGRLDREARNIRLRHAENKISRFATACFTQLPTIEPCIGAELEFSAKKPEVVVIERDTDAVLRMPDVGSDQNYLAIHIALSFALQRFFAESQSPVPGFLVLDQVSRPYYPTNSESDEAEIEGEEDEDTVAMRRHVDFLFAETARQSGLQVLLIEHAYFRDDPRYVAATRERWTKASGKALIPLEWPTRPDGVATQLF